MPPKKKSGRVVRSTMLIVGEGDAEEIFLRHIRMLYTSGNQGGYELKVRNARGKGAQNVIDHAIRLRAQADYDYVAALFDTDTDWNAAVCKRAEDHGVQTLQSEPCLEAWLLAIAGRYREGVTHEHKARFLAHFGCTADNERVFQEHFSRAVLDTAREQTAVLNRLLTLLGV